MRSLLAVLNVTGTLLGFFSLYYLLPIATALIYGEHAWRSFLAAALLTAAAGQTLRLLTHSYRTELKARDAYLLVTLGWLAIALSASAPFMMQIRELSLTDAFFESMSGLSTTGATVLSGLDELPRSLNLWRCALSWLGGMGIIVLAIAVLPLLGVGGMQMYRADTPGAVKDSKLAPRIAETARLLWLVYAGITAACALALWVAGMPPFDAICHAFSTLALGGFSTHDSGIAFYDSPLIEAVLTLFMLLAAMNFSTHFLAIRRGDLGVYGRDSEAKWLVVAVAGSSVVVSVDVFLSGLYPDYLTTFRHVIFSLVSVATGGGFVSTDYSRWPEFAPMWMLFLSCVCASTGSTGGGIKMFRSLILTKQSLREMFMLVHPSAVVPLKIANQVVQNQVVQSVLAFIFLYFMTVVVLSFTLLLSGLDFISAFSAIIACINNVGPGLGVVGPAANYSALTDFQTWVCTAAMFLGRIELLTFLVLLTPAFWRK
ncbi:MAG: potassium transporter TrkG [Steroidobacteraceae bacterium]